MTEEEFKQELAKFSSWCWEHKFEQVEEEHIDKANHYIDSAISEGQKLPVFNVSRRSELLAFAKEMQNIGFNDMDDIEKVVDFYLKANCD